VVGNRYGEGCHECSYRFSRAYLSDASYGTVPGFDTDKALHALIPLLSEKQISYPFIDSQGGIYWEIKKVPSRIYLHLFVSFPRIAPLGDDVPIPIDFRFETRLEIGSEAIDGYGPDKCIEMVSIWIGKVFSRILFSGSIVKLMIEE